MTMEYPDRKRVIVDLILMLAVFFAPFFIVFAVALAGLFLFPRWWEVVVCGVALDLLYMSGGGAYFGGGSAILFSATMVSVLLFLANEFLRAILRERIH